MSTQNTHHKKRQEVKSSPHAVKGLDNEEKAMIAVILVLLISIGFLGYPYFKNLSNKEKIYSLKIIKIEGCDNCFDLSSISGMIGQISNANIKEEKTLDYRSDEAKKLMDKYGIRRIPALIAVSNKISELSLDENTFRKTQDAAIFDKAVPYIEAGSDKIGGLVDLKEIYDSQCKECKGLSSIKNQLEKLGINIKNYEMVDSSSDAGEEMIKKNNVTFLPALLVSNEVEEYWWAFDKIKGYFERNDEYYKFSSPFFPYKEISTGLIKGKVSITYITNKSCADCFNVTQFKYSLQNIGIYINSEKHVDISSSDGKKLRKAYNITAIPAFILSEEIYDYTSIKDILGDIGTFEEDKTFVLRRLDMLNVNYQNLNNK